jgi:polyhydroxyalkanoate synthase
LFISLLRNETIGKPELAAVALAGLNVYQAAPRTPRPAAMPVIARAGRAVLRDYGGDGIPAVFIPSLINPPEVLDLAEGNSMLRWFAQHGVRPLLVDWGSPAAEEHALSVAGHVETLLLPLLDAAGRDAAIVGYCLGGTMALAAAMLRPPVRLATIAAPWRFSGYSDEARAQLGWLWATARPLAEDLGLCPMELLQAAFWMLDPARVVEKYAGFGRMDPDSADARAFVDLEDWSNGGPPLTLAAGVELIEGFMRDDVPGSGQWMVAGTRIDPQQVGCPILEIVSSSDRIVPMATAAGAGTMRSLQQGHVGMVVGGRAREVLWEPLADWIRQG